MSRRNPQKEKEAFGIPANRGTDLLNAPSPEDPQASSVKHLPIPCPVSNDGQISKSFRRLMKLLLSKPRVLKNDRISVESHLTVVKTSVTPSAR